MQKTILILALAIGSIIVGYGLRWIVSGGPGSNEDRLLGLSRGLKLASFFVFQPITYAGTFWVMSLADVPLMLFPALGLVSVFLAGGVSLIVVRTVRLPPDKGASVFVAGMFSNVLTFGGLIGFVYFGENGYILAQLFTMFIAPAYVLVGYPVSHNIAKGISPIFQVDRSFFRRYPFLLFPISAMAAGLVLNVSGLERPGVMDTVVAINIPLVAALLGLAIGLSLKPARIGGYRREIGIVLLIKFVLIPALLIPLGWALGLPAVGDGTPFKMLIVLSVMPVAFNALVPPAIFGFDLDLANSAWIVTTASLVVIVPLLYFVLA